MGCLPSTNVPTGAGFLPSTASKDALCLDLPESFVQIPYSGTAPNPGKQTLRSKWPMQV